MSTPQHATRYRPLRVDCPECKADAPDLCPDCATYLEDMADEEARDRHESFLFSYDGD